MTLTMISLSPSATTDGNGGILAVIDVRIDTCPADPNDICCTNVVSRETPTPAPTQNLGCGIRNELGVTANFQGFNVSLNMM